MHTWVSDKETVTNGPNVDGKLGTIILRLQCKLTYFYSSDSVGTDSPQLSQ